MSIMGTLHRLEEEESKEGAVMISLYTQFVIMGGGGSSCHIGWRWTRVDMGRLSRRAVSVIGIPWIYKLNTVLVVYFKFVVSAFQESASVRQ